MADLVLPPDLSPSNVTWQLVDYTGASSSPFSGTLRTVGRGQRWAATYAFRNLNGARRARILALAAALEGKSTRIWLTDPAYQQIGSFPGGEIFTNPQFTNGTTGWLAQNSTLSAQSGRLRVTNTKATGANNFAAYQAPTLAAGFPYVLRSILATPKTQSEGIYGAAFRPSNVYASGNGGLFTNSDVNVSNGSWTNYAGVFDTAGTATLAGDFGEILYTTLQQCAQVDNAPNLLPYSAALTNAAWTQSACSIAAYSGITAPDGTTSAYALTDTTSNVEHYIDDSISVSAANANYIASISAAAGAVGFLFIQLWDGTNGVLAWFNLSTGAIGTVSTGTNWADSRAYIVNQGNGWYRCHLAGLKTGGQTSVAAVFGPASTNGSFTYAGAGTRAIYLFEATLAQSAVPVAFGLTAGAATSGTNQAGTILNVRGLPISTSRLLAMGDRFEVNGEIKIATADVNSDASGLGVFQFEPALRTAHPDADPIIIGAPLGRFALIQDPKWTNVPAFFSDIDLQFIEA